MFVKKVRQRLEVRVRRQYGCRPVLTFSRLCSLVVSPCARKRHASARHCPSHPIHALCSPLFPLLRLQHPRWNRGRRCVRYQAVVVPNSYNSWCFCQARVPYTLSTQSGHTNAKHAALQVQRNHLCSPSWTTRLVIYPLHSPSTHREHAMRSRAVSRSVSFRLPEVGRDAPPTSSRFIPSSKTPLAILESSYLSFHTLSSVLGPNSYISS